LARSVLPASGGWLGFEVGRTGVPCLPGAQSLDTLVVRPEGREVRRSRRTGSFKGSQRYAIPPGVNPKDYQSVIIWCERFGVLIPPADLTTAMAAR
jgi:hypothetical protein